MSRVYLDGGLLLPLDDQNRLIDPGVVIFERGQITFVGPREAAPPPDGATVHDCANLIIMPGLINTHTHTGMSYFRNLLEDLTSPEWFRYELAAEQYLSQDDVYWAALLGIYELLRQGVTTIADRFSHMTQIVKALEWAGIRAIIAPSLVDRNVDSHGVELRQSQALQLLAQYGTCGEGLIQVGLGPVGPDTCSTELLLWIRTQADEHRALIFIHLAQSRQELAEIALRGYQGSVRYLDAIGFLGPDVVAAHCIYLDDDEMALLADSGVRVAHCPASNAKIEGMVAPILALEEAGVQVGLGTDCAASNNGMDMFSEMKSAGLLQKVATQDPTVMPAAHLLSLATQKAADCLNLGEKIGSLSVGKRADIITVQRDAPWLQPSPDPYAGLVYATRGLDVRDVWVDGRQRVSAGHLMAPDVATAVERAKDWAAHNARHLFDQRVLH